MEQQEQQEQQAQQARQAQQQLLALAVPVGISVAENGVYAQFTHADVLMIVDRGVNAWQTCVELIGTHTV